MRISAVLVATLALGFGAAACGGDDDGGGGAPVDAPLVVDAPVDAATDAAVSTMGLGNSCTGMGQGSCPAGLTCLSGLQGASGPWCSTECTPVAPPSPDGCANGYSGPGLPACILRVTYQNGPTVNMCGIVCRDEPGGEDYCPGCSGMCPGTMVCDAPLMSSSGTILARGCR